MDCNMPGLPVHHRTPGVYSNSCLLNQWCHPTISSSVFPFSSHLQSFPASGSFQMTQFFASVPLYKQKTERDLLNCLFQLPSSTEIPSLGFLTTRWPLLLFLQWREHARFLTFFPLLLHFPSVNCSFPLHELFLDGVLNQGSLPCPCQGRGKASVGDTWPKICQSDFLSQWF